MNLGNYVKLELVAKSTPLPGDINCFDIGELSDSVAGKLAAVT